MKYNFSIMLLAIHEYSMNETEEAAYRMLLDYMELKIKYFPGYMLESIGTVRDPRKSHYFRLCHKAVLETTALGLPRHCRRYYVQAQLQILKMVEGNSVPITMECLIGPKAWKRWLVWWSRFQKQRNKPLVSEIQMTAEIMERIKRDVISSVAFLKKRRADLTKAVGNGDLNRWVKTGVVSPYYLVLIPQGQDYADKLGIDISGHALPDELKTQLDAMINKKC